LTVKLGINILSLNAQRRLSESSNSLQRSFERLSSGLRINRASDDAAGLSIANSLNANGRIFGQGIRNINDGISMLNIAEGGLQQLGSINMRIRELAAQSANGTYSSTQRRSVDSEADALVAEFNRITNSVSFNGQKLLSGELRNLVLQMGGNSLSTSLGGNLGTQVGNGIITSGTSLSFTTGGVTSEISMIDLNGDGKLDMVHGGNSSINTGLYVRMGNGDGTFGDSTGYQGYFNNRFVMADVNGDGHLDALGYGNIGGNFSVTFGNGDGSFGAMSVFNPLDGATAKGITNFSVGDFNGDGRVDVAVVMADLTVGTNSMGIYYGNGNGTFNQGVSLNVGVVGQFTQIAAGDFNNDGIDDIVLNNQTDGFISTLIGARTGISKSAEFRFSINASTDIVAGDFNGDGILDIAANYQDANTLFIGLGNGNGTFGSVISILGSDTDYTSLTVGDLNGDGNLDIVSSDFSNNRASIFLGNGNGQFSMSSSFALGGGSVIRKATIADIDGDGSMELVIGRNAAGAFILNQTDSYSTQMATLNLNNQNNARSVLGYLDEIDQRIRNELSSIGSLMSRLNYSANNLRTSREQFAAAQSRIEDVDIAEETSNLLRSKILQQVGASILAKSNLQPSLVLDLLRT
jgi:flagellin